MRQQKHRRGKFLCQLRMKYEAFLADFPANQALEFACVKETEEEMRRLGIDQRMRQSGTGKWRSHLAMRSINGAELSESCHLLARIFPRLKLLSRKAVKLPSTVSNEP